MVRGVGFREMACTEFKYYALKIRWCIGGIDALIFWKMFNFRLTWSYWRAESLLKVACIVALLVNVARHFMANI